MTGRAKAPTQDRRRRDTRDRLVNAAVEVFRRRGPGGAGLAEVCKRGNTTKGVLSHHFPGGKAELLTAAIKQSSGEVSALLEDLIEQSPTVPKTIRAFFDTYADLLDADPNSGCPVAAAVVDSSAEDPEVRQLAAEAFFEWTRTIADALVEQGWRREAARQMATTTVAAAEGAILLARAGDDPDLVRQTGRWLARIASKVNATIPGHGSSGNGEGPLVDRSQRKPAETR